MSSASAPGAGEEGSALHRRWTRDRERRLLDALSELPAGSPVLDAGCGDGTFSGLLLERGYAVTGIDVSGEAIRRASSRYPGIKFIESSLEGDPSSLEEGFFHAAWCSEVLEHIHDVDSALRNLNRALRPGGTLIITVPYHGALKNLAIAGLAFEKHYDPRSEHLRFFTRKSLSRCLEDAGFSVEYARGTGRVWPFYMSLFVSARKAGL